MGPKVRVSLPRVKPKKLHRKIIAALPEGKSEKEVFIASQTIVTWTYININQLERKLARS